MRPVTVRDIEQAVAKRFPLERAEEWDRCGLLVGDPDGRVSGVVLALDPTVEVVEEALALGANVVVTHHPAFLSPPERLTPGRGSADVVFAALSKGVALINAHTNLDRDEQAQRLIPIALGLDPLGPLEHSLQPGALVTVFVPTGAADTVSGAMAEAGAGRIGRYERCSFTVEGKGTFVPPEGSHPAVGTPGERGEASEVRVEMICPPAAASVVVAAAVAAHPYEEPLVVVEQGWIARNNSRLGMLSNANSGTTLVELARTAAEVYGCVPRVWGEADAPAALVASATGSAGSLVGEVIASRAQAFVAGEVRYHDALEAVSSGVGVIELGHDVTEWPLVSLLDEAVRAVEGLASRDVHALGAERRWWTPDECEGAL